MGLIFVRPHIRGSHNIKATFSDMALLSNGGFDLDVLAVALLVVTSFLLRTSKS
jgi:hypothetical protein